VRNILQAFATWRAASMGAVLRDLSTFFPTRARLTARGLAGLCPQDGQLRRISSSDLFGNMQAFRVRHLVIVAGSAREFLDLPTRA